VPFGFRVTHEDEYQMYRRRLSLRSLREHQALAIVFTGCSSRILDSKSVKSLIQGPSAFICNECVAVCNKVLRGARLPRFPRWDELSDEQLLGIFRSSCEAERHALKVQIDALRKRKVGWSTIGKVLGVSRQAAWQRFS
jgi:hypothetical protein